MTCKKNISRMKKKNSIDILDFRTETNYSILMIEQLDIFYGYKIYRKVYTSDPVTAVTTINMRPIIPNLWCLLI